MQFCEILLEDFYFYCIDKVLYINTNCWKNRDIEIYGHLRNDCDNPKVTNVTLM